MTRVLVVSAVLALSGCASTPPGEYRQAVARPAPAGPLIVQQPPSYPGATYTPAGAGAYRGDPLPSKPVPRSPNKRVLPATREPGLWAADGEPVATAGAANYLYGVDIPLPDDGAGFSARFVVGACLRGLERAATAADAATRLAGSSEGVRRCLAARALLACADDGVRNAEATLNNPLAYDPTALDRRREAAAYARAMTEKYCADVSVADDEERTNKEVIAEWYRELTHGLKRH